MEKKEGLWDQGKYHMEAHGGGGGACVVEKKQEASSGSKFRDQQWYQALRAPSQHDASSLVAQFNSTRTAHKRAFHSEAGRPNQFLSVHKAGRIAGVKLQEICLQRE